MILPTDWIVNFILTSYLAMAAIMGFYGLWREWDVVRAMRKDLVFFRFIPFLIISYLLTGLTWPLALADDLTRTEENDGAQP